MRGKAGFVLGAALGYVLGTRAGRARYEQIKRGAIAVWETPLVQQGVSTVKDTVGDRVDDMKAAAGRAAKSAFFAATQPRGEHFAASASSGAAPEAGGSASATSRLNGTATPVEATQAPGSSSGAQETATKKQSSAKEQASAKTSSSAKKQSSAKQQSSAKKASSAKQGGAAEETSE